METSTVATIDRSPDRGGPGVPCYICGRNYKGGRMDMHVKACRRRYEASEEQKPLEERKPLPIEPANFRS